jgi:hypothetical protein
MPGTFERFYKKFGNPIDYKRASILCDEADQLITDLQLKSHEFKYSEVEEKAVRLVTISRVLESKYFGVKAKASS